MSRRGQGGFGLTAVDVIVAVILLFVLWTVAVREFPRLDRKVASPAPTSTAAPD